MKMGKGYLTLMSENTAMSNKKIKWPNYRITGSLHKRKIYREDLQFLIFFYVKFNHFVHFGQLLITPGISAFGLYPLFCYFLYSLHAFFFGSPGSS